MYVIKRNGVKAPVLRDKIGARIRKLSYHLMVADKSIEQIVDYTMRQITTDGIHTCEIDRLVARYMTKDTNCDSVLQILAARIEASNLHKETIKRFSTVHNIIYRDDPRTITEEEHDFVVLHQDQLDSAIISDRDYKLPYSTLIEEEDSYLYRMDNKIIERPSHRYMRVAISSTLTGKEKMNDILEAVLATYEKLSLASAIN